MQDDSQPRSELSQEKPVREGLVNVLSVVVYRDNFHLSENGAHCVFKGVVALVGL